MPPLQYSELASVWNAGNETGIVENWVAHLKVILSGIVSTLHLWLPVPCHTAIPKSDVKFKERIQKFGNMTVTSMCAPWCKITWINSLEQ